MFMSSKRTLALLSGLAFSSVQAVVPLYGQCGGISYTGETTCDSGSFCKYYNDWFFQCVPGTAPSATATTATAVPSATASGGLCGWAKKHGKKYWGVGTDPSFLNIPVNVAVMKANFCQVTALNSMKWDAVEPVRGTFNYNGGDTVVKFAETNGFLVRGMTLVWHYQLPRWVSSITDASDLASVIQNHVTNTATRWKGKIYAWDVVNEVFNEDGSIKTTVFSTLLGEDFIDIAFKAARAADPIAKLYISDYLDKINPKVKAIVNMVIKKKAAGVPIDGIGTQAHLDANSTSGVQAALTELATAGAEVAITELDIKGASVLDYTTVAKACVAVPACVGITSAALSDKDSWRSQDKPLLFDGNYQAKPARDAILALE